MIDRRKGGRIGSGIELALDHVGGAVVDTGANRENHRDRCQPGEQRHRAALVTAETLRLMNRTAQNGNDICHWRSPDCYPVTHSRRCGRPRKAAVTGAPSRAVAPNDEFEL